MLNLSEIMKNQKYNKEEECLKLGNLSTFLRVRMKQKFFVLIVDTTDRNKKFHLLGLVVGNNEENDD